MEYDINRESGKISALSWDKFEKYEYFTDEEILPSNQKQVVQETEFNYLPLETTYEKHIKVIKDQRDKQIEAIEESNTPAK